MISAVMVEAPATEGLRNYLIGGRGRPVDVRAFDQSGVRQPLGLPNGAVPGVQKPIPTSSARPGKITNQRIVYTRVQTSFPKACGAIDMTPVREGDAVFVHRLDGLTSAGHDTNRTSRVATLQQLNNVLRSYSGVAGAIGSIVMPIMKDANVLSPAGLNKGDYVAERVAAGAAVPDATKEWENGLKNDGTSLDRTAYRWKHCSCLAQWTPDGILANNEHDCTMDNSNPGEAYNIAIGGPTLMRNAAAGDFPQHFDDGTRTLDKVFIGLIATEKRKGDAGTGEPIYWTYQYKLFTSRQLLWAKLAAPNAAQTAIDVNAAHAGGDNSLGPTPAEFRRMVQVWRIGSVFDTRTGMMPYKCVTLNVVIEEWTFDRLAAEFNSAFASSIALFPLAVADTKRTADNLVTAALAAWTPAVIDSIQVVYNAFAPLQISSDDLLDMDAIVTSWQEVEFMYQENLRQAALFTPPIIAANVPVPVVGPHGYPDAVTRNYQGDTTGKRRPDAPLYSRPPTPAIRSLLAARIASNAVDPAAVQFVLAPGPMIALLGRAVAVAPKLPLRAAAMAPLVRAHDMYMSVGAPAIASAKIDGFLGAIAWNPMV